ncbi:MAG: preprotein translocase subunit YajC [Treponema sp.]|nr:preprotein translocase subunit YajC [Treponema sp.]
MPLSILLQIAQNPANASSSIVTTLMLVSIFVIFYVFMIRPQNKKQKETEKMIAALKKGDKVITIGGIHGVVTSTKEKTIVIKVDDSTKIEFSRSAVSSVVVDEKAKEKNAKVKKTAEAEKIEATDSNSETAE